MKIKKSSYNVDNREPKMCKGCDALKKKQSIDNSIYESYNLNKWNKSQIVLNVMVMLIVMLTV